MPVVPLLLVLAGAAAAVLGRSTSNSISSTHRNSTLTAFTTTPRESCISSSSLSCFFLCGLQVLSLSPSSSKGTYRKAKALGGLRRYAEAEELCLEAYQRLTAGKASKSPAASEAAAFRRLHEKLVRERTIWEKRGEQKIQQQHKHQHKMQQLPQRDKTAEDISRNYAKKEQQD